MTWLVAGLSGPPVTRVCSIGPALRRTPPLMSKICDEGRGGGYMCVRVVADVGSGQRANWGP